MRCQTCQSAIDNPSARFCPSCGGRIVGVQNPASDAITIDPPSGTRDRYAEQHQHPAPRSAAPMGLKDPLASASAPSLHGRFTPGQILAGRYRIVGLLGKGGMGEVYRADDLTLGVAVALKFLPPGLSNDPHRLQRFLSEVRTTRQISHPSVCRVYDVGEIDGAPFLSMEFVDGEDLASLLRRIGRLPREKCLEIARQVCAGLAAAHELGIVHRDLKPANVMLDGRGRARVMDFGVAGVASALNATGDIAAGTPAYMAPEQLAGRAVTVRSDLYSLGLLLYELFTGASVWAERATSIPELRRLHEGSAPARPSSIINDLDGAVERVIMRCLEREPESRPAGALAVAAALPGGDPLAAALAAGETPSPELVAASSRIGAISGRAACIGAVAFALLLTAMLMLVERVSINRVSSLPLSTEALSLKAREMLETLGHKLPAADHAMGLETDDELIAFLRKSAVAAGHVGWWESIRDERMPVVQFFYRISGRRLEPARLWQPFVYYDEPLQTLAGSARLMLDQTGRLLRYETAPERVAVADAVAVDAETDWAQLFEFAGLEMEKFRPAAPAWSPLFAGSRRAAWTGELPSEPPVPMRIEAAAERGRPTSFQLVFPWSTPDRSIQPETRSTLDRIVQNLLTGLVLCAIFGSAFLAWKNLRARRSDLRGAFIVGAVVFFTTAFMLVAPPARLDQVLVISIIDRPVARALWLGMLAWLFYVALEPVVRRLWPDMLVSWTRALKGQFKDPLVGRDLFIGAGVGLLEAVLVRGGLLVNKAVGHVPLQPSTINFDVLRGARPLIAILAGSVGTAVILAMLFVLLLIAMRLLLRSNNRATVAVILLLFIMQIGQFSTTPPSLVVSALISTIVIMTIVRGGLLAAAMVFFVANTITLLPLTTDFSVWYASTSLVAMALLVGVAAYGLYTALAGEKLTLADPERAIAPR